ncbi:MAG: glycosyltransferase family 4 protein [Bdellovibrionales bacterium]|nr:glycosyltransferase family 4 protein [Bdellovibrionales bacterium]
MKTSGLPRVLIDGRMVGDVSHGISRYVRMIAKGLAERPSLPYEPVFFVAPGMGAYFSGFETIEQRTPFLDPKELALIPIALYRAKAKLYHSPSFSSLPAAPCPWIVTIHDLNHLTYGGAMERAYYETLLRSFAQRAKVVTTVSEFSKGEIERWDPRLRPEVVYNAIDPQFLKEGGDILPALERFRLERDRYFICLSNEKPHKNLDTLVRAFHAFRESGAAAKEFRLVVTAKKYANESGVLAVEGMSDSDAHALIRGSRALAFPSIYEGFGLPPVEAAALGARLLVSDIPAHREALRDLGPADALWVKPLAEAEWTAAFKRAATGGLHPVLGASRDKMAARYSVAKLGQAMDRIYRRVLGIP